MEFAVTEEQQLLQKTVQQFALEKLLPNYMRWDRGERLDKKQLEAWRQRWRLSLAGGASGDQVLYLKRFNRPPLMRQFQRWCSGHAYRSSARGALHRERDKS